MDLDALVNEIYRRVQERVAACEAEPEAEVEAEPETVIEEAANHIGVVRAEDKPVLGIISENHGEICHKVYECKQLAEYYRMRCALLEDTWDVENWEAVIAYTLTNEALGKIVNGIFDTKAFGKALLCGKKIYVPEEDVELYHYCKTAPREYYRKLEANLEILKKSGVEILPNEQIGPAILGSECCTSSTEVEVSAKTEEKDLAFEKRVLSERDMIMAHQGKVTRILVNGKTIVTDLAKDYAKKYHIVIEKVDC